MRHFAALFELLADIEKALALGRGALGGVILPLRHDEVVIGLYHGHDQAASGNFGAGPRHRFRRQRAPVVRDPLQGNVLMNIALAEVLVHSVGPDESPRGRAIALGVEKACVVVHTRQQGSAALYPVFLRGTVGGQRGPILRIILPRAGDGILQGHRQRSGARSLIWSWGQRQSQ